MRLHLPVRSLLCAAALAFGAAHAFPQEAAERTERVRQARERWEKLSPDERTALLRRFEKWSKLTPEQREDLRRRFDDFGGREGTAVVRRRMEDLRQASPEQIQRMRLQAALLGRLWERFQGTLPPRIAERLAALPPGARERLRLRFCQRIVAVGREAMVRKYATEPERAALEGSDPEARRAAMAAMKARIRDAVLLPRKEELERLDPAARKARMVGLLEENFWDCAREAHQERLTSIRAALEKALNEKGEKAQRRGPEQRNGKDWFEREFGVSQADLGARWAGRPLMMALSLRSPDSQPAFLAGIRPELRRIAALPAAEREEALKALLEKIR